MAKTSMNHLEKSTVHFLKVLFKSGNEHIKYQFPAESSRSIFRMSQADSKIAPGTECQPIAWITPFHRFLCSKVDSDYCSYQSRGAIWKLETENFKYQCSLGCFNVIWDQVRAFKRKEKTTCQGLHVCYLEYNPAATVNRVADWM